MLLTIHGLLRDGKSWALFAFLVLVLVNDVHAAELDPALSGMKTADPIMPAHLTGELRKLNSSLSQGVSPQQNAVVILVEIFSPAVFEPALRPDSMDMLGIVSVSEQSPRFEYIGPYVKKQVDSPDDYDQIEELTNQIHVGLLDVAVRPWQRADNEALAGYLDENQDALNLFVAASKLPKYYAPLLAEEMSPSLMSASMAVEYRLEFVCRCLNARATLRLAEKDLDGGFSDLLASHRIARLLAAGSPLDVSIAKAHQIDAITCRTEMGIMESGILSGAQALQLLGILSKLPEITAPEIAADIGERAIIQQEIDLLQTDEDSVIGFFEHGEEDVSSEVEAFQKAEIQWDLVRERANEIQDNVVQALSMHKNLKLQLKRFQQLEEQFEQWKAANDEHETSFEESFRADPARTSREIGESIAYALRTNCWQRKLTHSRGQNRSAMVLIGLALISYHSQYETYPADLTDLAPQFLPTVPLDVFSNEPFNYVRDGESQARLTSWGANKVDDAGKRYNDDQILTLH